MNALRGWTFQQWGRQVRSLLDGARYVNLGIGLPTRLADGPADDGEVFFHCENGLIGISGPPDDESLAVDELVDAGGRPTTLREGAAVVDLDISFGIIRGGHLDATVLGGFQVSQSGDLANWSPLGSSLAGVGGAMDLATGCRRLIVMMHHLDRDGRPKLVEQLDLPVTARGCTDFVVTEYASIAIVEERFVVTDVAPGVSRTQLQDMTNAPLHFAADWNSTTSLGAPIDVAGAERS